MYAKSGTPRALIVSLATALIATGGARAETAARQKWLDAARSASRSWSRESLAPALLGQTQLATRDQAVALFGPPDLTSVYYSPGQGFDGQLDEYRLSGANDKILRFSAGADGGLSGPTIESGACACPSCLKARQAAASAVSGAEATRYLTSLKEETNSRPPLSAVERALGRPGVRSTSETVVGGQNWAGIEAVWPIADNPHRFLIFWGNTPARNRPNDDDMPIAYFTDVVVSDLCLAP